MKILGIESTCDETGIATVENGTKVLANNLATSVFVQAKYGGIVPEIAAREQVRLIIPTLESIIKKISVGYLDAIAVSYGPGLIGSLLVGVESAKALAIAWNKPLIPINHLAAHIYANWLDAEKIPEFPVLGLVVSGGHTDLLYIKKHGDFKLISSTLDDAAGEAFDKVARFLGLAYPGGPQIETAAKNFKACGEPNPFPVSMMGKESFDFSFSGIKTSVVRYVERRKLKLSDAAISKIAFFFEQSVVESITLQVKRALATYNVRSLVVGGGVAANGRLRKELNSLSSKSEVRVYFPKPDFSVDNGAMIASAAYFAGKAYDPLTVQADSGLHFI